MPSAAGGNTGHLLSTFTWRERTQGCEVVRKPAKACSLKPADTGSHREQRRAGPTGGVRKATHAAPGVSDSELRLQKYCTH